MAFYLAKKRVASHLVIMISSPIQHFEFEKAAIPSGKDEKIEFMAKLAKYKVSIKQYECILQQKEITP